MLLVQIPHGFHALRKGQVPLPVVERLDVGRMRIGPLRTAGGVDQLTSAVTSAGWRTAGIGLGDGARRRNGR